MAVSRFRELLLPWTSQPQEFARAAPDVTLLFAPGVSPSSVAAPAAVTAVGAPVTGRPGIGRYYSGTNASSTAAGVIQLVGDQPRWHLWQGRLFSSVNNWFLGGVGHEFDPAGNSSYLRLYTTLTIGFLQRNNYATIVEPTVAIPGGAYDDMVVLGYSASRTDHRLFVCCNGVIASTSSTSDIGAPTGKFDKYSIASNGACSQYTYLSAFGTSPLTDARITELLLNPWSAYEPQRIMVPVPAAGSTSPWPLPQGFNYATQLAM